MATTNPITGDSLVSRGYSEQGRENHERIFGKKPSDGQCKKCGGILIREDERLKCEACGWSIRNNPQECGAYNAGGNATERSEGRVDHNVGRQTEE